MIQSSGVYRIYHQNPWLMIEFQSGAKGEELREFASLLSELADGREEHIRFDVSRLTDINVSFLNILVLFPGKIRRNNPDVRLEIIYADENIFNLFRMTGLDCAYRLLKGPLHGKG
ncbi:MAG: hypothetical protein V2I97_06745 [Desulfococcaceae bacterium]|jgi:hypothetical protein|nr:hypothetical protein [Desulfococcaceae bacterium]